MRRALSLLLTTLAAASAANCSNSFCEKDLSNGYLLRYKLNEADSTITMELTYTGGDVWLGIAVSDTGLMAGSEAVIGSSVSTPQKYLLKAPTLPSESAIELMWPEEQTLMDASCDFVNGQTVMKFTKALKEDNEIEITMGDNTFLWAYGNSPTIGYHVTRSSFILNLEAAEQIKDGTTFPTPSTSPPAATPFPSVSAPVASSQSSEGETETNPIKIGDDICVTGYIMDTYCIELGYLLDDPSTDPLEEPENHSFHCMLDVPVCYNSGFNVLGPKDKEGRHCLGFRLDSKDAVLTAGRAAGSRFGSSTHYTCNTCSGDASKPVSGYRATVKGTVKELGDGKEGVNGQPLLTNIQLLDASVECDAPFPPSVCMGIPDEQAGESEPEVPADNVESAPEAEEPCPLDFCVPLLDGHLAYTVNEADGTVTMEVRHDGDAWVALAFNDGSKMMAGSDAVIGSTETGKPQKYRLFTNSPVVDSAIQLMPPEQQTLINASIEYKDGQTLMRFTKTMNEPDEIPISMGDNDFLWAYGMSPTIGYHGPNRQPIVVNLSSGSSEVVQVPNMAAWLAHGICAFVAWGVLAPAAVQSALMRALFKGKLWFQIHQYFNSLAFVLTIASFAIAVAFTQKEGSQHFTNNHEKMGLAMFIMVALQVLGGGLRPHVPDPGEEKTTVRKGWEIGHRVLGITLLACGFWQMYAGIQLYAIKYGGVGSSEERAVTTAYWVWIAFDCALLVIGGVYFKFLRSTVEQSDEKEHRGTSDVAVDQVDA